MFFEVFVDHGDSNGLGNELSFLSPDFGAKVLNVVVEKGTSKDAGEKEFVKGRRVVCLGRAEAAFEVFDSIIVGSEKKKLRAFCVFIDSATGEISEDCGDANDVVDGVDVEAVCFVIEGFWIPVYGSIAGAVVRAVAHVPVAASFDLGRDRFGEVPILDGGIMRRDTMEVGIVRSDLGEIWISGAS